MNCVELRHAHFKELDVRGSRVACVLGMPPFQWEVAPERYGFCGNCEHEFREGEQVFGNNFSIRGVVLERFYCNKDCANYSERERLRPCILKYAATLQDWKGMLDALLETRDEPLVGSFSSSAERTAFVSLQRRVVALLLKLIDSMLKRNTKMYRLFKLKLQEEWCEMLALCINDSMTLHTAAEMKQFESLTTIARYFVEEVEAV